MTEPKSTDAPYEGFDPKYDYEVDRETGCFISMAGTMPEAGWWFLYHDHRYHFYFRASQLFEVDGYTYDVCIDYFSTEKFGASRDQVGRSPTITRADFPIIQRNMEKFFGERNFFSAARPRDPRSPFRHLTFNFSPRFQLNLI